jgi:hypothetical protein
MSQKKGKQVLNRVDERLTIRNIMSSITEEECSQLWLLLEKLLSAGIKELDKYYICPYTR